MSLPPASAAARVLAPGHLCDLAGLRVGHAEVAGGGSGCSVVLCPPGTVAGVAQRGAAPGTRETDLLRPENSVAVVHALLLSGGSAYGLDAAGGVMRWLEARGLGLPVGEQLPRPVRVPIVPAAVLFDLRPDGPGLRPEASTGIAACEAAMAGSSGQRVQGRVGAGAGARVGRLFGPARSMPGGIGSASLQLGGHTVAALVAVNAVGDVLDAQGAVLAGARSEDGLALQGSTAALLAGKLPPTLRSPFASGSLAGSATTIGVLATDAALDKAGCSQLAQLACNGLPRAIDPLTPFDGDTLFALATCSSSQAVTLPLLGMMAAEVVARAVRNAVIAAQAEPAR